MLAKWLMPAALAATLCGCASDATKRDCCESHDDRAAAKTDEVESGEVKVKLDQTPPAVQKTIRAELVGAELEDIAKKTWRGKTVYETDIIRGKQKWEVIIDEDGVIVSKLQEGSAAERAIDKSESAAKAGAWRDRFDVKKSDLTPRGNNAWITMQPGRVLKLRNAAGDHLTITVMQDTLSVDGVEVGVLEEHETKNGQLAEISRNFFATDKTNGDVYYFGEDVDNYKDGKVINHDSAWRSGVDGARFGLMIPGKPKVGDMFYQEIAPKVALDRVEIVSLSEMVKTPAGTFEGCMHIRETTPLEPDVSHKYYAPGVGIIKDDDFELAEKPQL